MLEPAWIKIIMFIHRGYPAGYVARVRYLSIKQPSGIGRNDVKQHGKSVVGVITTGTV